MRQISEPSSVETYRIVVNRQSLDDQTVWFEFSKK